MSLCINSFSICAEGLPGMESDPRAETREFGWFVSPKGKQLKLNN